MDSWPCANTYVPKKKQTDHDAVKAHPRLQQGMVGAVTLAENDGRFEWAFLRTSRGDSPNNWRVSKPFKVFPETRGPSSAKSPFGSKVSAQHGANFIRTCMPETDVPLELIREQLEEQDVKLNQTQTFDPFAGSTLTSSLPQMSGISSTGFIAFPMGDVMCDLNVSSIIVSKDEGLRMKPVAGYKRVFTTPIQQLVAGSLTLADHMLGVRTYAALDFLRLRESRDKSTWEIESGPKLTMEDTRGQEVMDFRFRFDTAILVNEIGGVSSIQPFSHKPNLVEVAVPSEDMQPKDPEFWRVAFDQGPDSGYVMSSDDISLFDIRSSGPLKKSFELGKPSEFLTSIEDCGSDHIVRACSTSHIYWLDRRKMGVPALSVRHDRQFDRYLSTTTIGSTNTFLTSRRNNMISVYDVSHGSDKLLHMRDEPYGLLPPFPSSGSAGQTFISSPFLHADSHATLLKLSDRGAISGCTILFSGYEGSLNIDVKYTTALQSIEAQSWEEKEGLMLEQDRTQLNMAPIYDKIFRQHYEELPKFEEQEASQVYELVDEIPAYFRRSDAVQEQLFTTYDVAFRTGEEPKDPSRSDFLTGSILNSERGHRALRQGRIKTSTLAQTAKWHMDLTPTLKCLGLPDATVDSEGGEPPFSQYNLKDSDERTAGSLRYEKRFREQLELDLALSRNVYSSQPFTGPSEMDQTLEVMTEALSLGDAPPEVDFGFLHPVLAGDDSEKEEPRKEQGVGLGMGVRLLLKDWEIGSNLAKYQYQDPYNTAEATPVPRRAPILPPAQSAAPPQLLTQTQTQSTTQTARPPMVVPQLLSQPSAAPAMRRTGTDSQKIVPGLHSQSQTQSQDVVMASTQVLPGPFGGRPTKKKAEKKKRLGGF